MKAIVIPAFEGSAFVGVIPKSRGSRIRILLSRKEKSRAITTLLKQQFERKYWPFWIDL
jgi:hypothetical protein